MIILGRPHDHTEWDESFSVGHETLDSHHRNLMRLVNDLNAALLSSYVADNDWELQNLIEITYEFILKHIACEDLYMREINYPRMRQHQAIHEDIKKQLNHLYHGIKGRDFILDTSTIQIFGKLLKDHILQEDAKYAEFAGKNK